MLFQVWTVGTLLFLLWWNVIAFALSNEKTWNEKLWHVAGLGVFQIGMWLYVLLLLWLMVRVFTWLLGRGQGGPVHCDEC
jgi:hypothetical protein